MLWSGETKIQLYGLNAMSGGNLTELESICREEWEKLPKLITSYSGRLKAVIAAKGASTKCFVKALNTAS
jgi:hypothetical protein